MPTCENKVCPAGKICNDKTGRCIKIKVRKPASCTDKICPVGSKCNPITLRCNKDEKQKNDDKVRRVVKKKSKMAAKLAAILETSNDKLYFYSKSRDVAAGKGANEIVADSSLYEELGKIKDWRKILSNFHLCKFLYEGNVYNTIEHVFQGKKIELVDKEKGYWFTVDSGHEIGLGDGEVARKHRKLCKLNAEQLKVWGMMKDDVMYKAAVAKYKACQEARNVLKLTNGAQLWHIVSRGKPVRFEHLERIREGLFD